MPVAVYSIALRPRPHVPVLSAPAGGSWSGFFSLSPFFVSSLMGAQATRCSPQLSADNSG
jgi:hypothetical protein